jgi:hypothetical protein
MGPVPAAGSERFVVTEVGPLPTGRRSVFTGGEQDLDGFPGSERLLWLLPRNHTIMADMILKGARHHCLCPYP